MIYDNCCLLKKIIFEKASNTSRQLQNRIIKYYTYNARAKVRRKEIDVNKIGEEKETDSMILKTEKMLVNDEGIISI